jgi:TldD protein
MYKIKSLASLLLFVIFNNASFAQDSLMKILSEEITREKEGLITQTIPPYYIDYRVDDVNSIVLSTSFGSLVGQNEDNDRILTCTVKVGNYSFDNSHDIAGTGSVSQPFVTRLPFENDADAIKMTLWQATHSAYRSAVDAFNQVQSGMKSDSKASKSADFSNEKPEVYYENQSNIKFNNREDWTKRLKQYSEPFLADDKVISADAILSFISVRKYFISTEGSQIVQNSSYCQLQIVAITKAEDGSSVPIFRSYYAFSPEGLPSDELIKKEINEMIVQLKMLRDAPIADAYSGPAILSCSAAAVFFHEIFGHRIEGQRMKSDFDSQTFKSKVNDFVLPKFMSVISDPTLLKFAGQDMFGYYKYDDQGVVAQKVVLVNNGILQNFLMSRSPIQGFPKSNGHGRAKAGMAPVSRQSNLIVETQKPLTDKELRKKLIGECKKEHKEYGYMFDQVVGGFTMTSRYSPNVFNVSPTIVYKIYVDGRPDELVRGVNFIGTPLAIFSEIEGTGDITGVFTGYCGAESGSIPVTAVSPALYIKKIETQKQPEGYGQMPILPRPDVEKLNKQ